MEHIKLNYKEDTLKYARIFVTLLFMMALVLSVTACKKHPPEIQPKPTAETPTVPETPSVPPPPTATPLQEGAITDATLTKCTSQLQPVFYDYNKSDIREDQINALQNNARVLKSEECAPANALIEGHCDERGTEEYNLALGERRARSSKDYLVSLGIAESRISTISYGESKPFAEGHNEEAWQQNRRAQFVALKK
ncbi:MAG TPA: OmpA family protein [Acidobacteriota bacterium]|nr:OmpA family protein [Acidobacteriota bacterium]